MLCVFERIYRPGPAGAPVVAEEVMIHPKHIATMDHEAILRDWGNGKPMVLGAPAYLRTEAGLIPLSPEKFSLREPETDRERYQARFYSLPEAVAQAMEQDGYLATALRGWCATGRIPVLSAESVGDPEAKPDLVEADLAAALAYALVGMVINKQAIMAAWAAREAATCAPVVVPVPAVPQ